MTSCVAHSLLVRLLLLFALAAICIPTRGLGQSTQTATLSGKVTDQQGLPVPGATVQLLPSNESAQQMATQVAGSGGEFTFSDRPFGAYTLTVSAPGFVAWQRKLNLSADFADLGVKLEIANFSQKVTVTSDSERLETTAPEENQSAITLDREALENLPALNQDVIAMASEFLGDGEEVTLVVDGVETNDLGVTASAIEAIRVNRNPYSAEYSRPGRTRIDVITKSGTVEYHGELNYSLRHFKLDSRNAFAATRPEQQRHRVEGNITGPIGSSGKTTFLLSGEYDDDREQTVVFAQTPESYVRQNLAAPEKEHEFDARINRYQNAANAFSWRYSYDKDIASGQGVGGFALPESAYATSRVRHGGFFNHKLFASPRIILDSTFRVQREDNTVSGGDIQSPRIIVNSAFTGGSSQRLQVSQETNLEGSTIFSYTGDKHTFRAGFLIPDWRRYNTLDQDLFGGEYFFASLADYQANRPIRYRQRVGNGAIDYWAKRAAAFVQDDWKLRPNITVGLGLRYDWQNYIGDGNNLSPRVSLAWGVGPGNNTVIRAGAGFFYDRLSSGVIRDTLRLNGTRLREILVVNPSYPVTPPELDAGLGTPSIMELSPTLQSPRILQTSVGVEHRWGRNTTLSVAYEHQRGSHLFRGFDLNAPLPPSLLRSNADYAEINRIRSDGTSKRHSLNVNLRMRTARWWQSGIRYRLGRMMDDVWANSGTPMNSLDISREWARTDWDRRHRLSLYSVLNTPGSFTVGTIVRASSGSPYDWTIGEDLNRDGSSADRPPGVFRNALQETGNVRLDLRLARKWELPGWQENTALSLSVDAINALNITNFTRFVGNQSSPLFLQPVASSSARRMQVSLEWEF